MVDQVDHGDHDGHLWCSGGSSTWDPPVQLDQWGGIKL